jgi:hypothetical protein
VTIKRFALICLLALSACQRQPATISSAGSSPTPALDSFQSDRVQLDQPFPQSANPAAQAPTETPQAEAQAEVFKSEVANQGLDRYSAEMEALKSATPPAQVDPIHDPNALTANLNQIGDHLRALQAARTQIESNLSPGERARWKELRQSLDQPQ